MANFKGFKRRIFLVFGLDMHIKTAAFSSTVPTFPQVMTLNIIKLTYIDICQKIIYYMS